MHDNISLMQVTAKRDSEISPPLTVPGWDVSSKLATINQEFTQSSLKLGKSFGKDLKTGEKLLWKLKLTSFKKNFRHQLIIELQSLFSISIKTTKLIMFLLSLKLLARN
jgi:hypothetical protein